MQLTIACYSSQHHTAQAAQSKQGRRGRGRRLRSATHADHTILGWLVIASYSSSRCSSLMALLSSMPGRCTSAGMTHAAATTGPARGPLPASSMPATALKPCRVSEWAR
jgi:hypothetical protein